METLDNKHDIFETSNYLAHNLQALLKKHDINANQLAHELGIPMMTVWRLSTGETRDPRISTLKLIANYFNVSVDALIASSDQAIVNPLGYEMSHTVPLLDWNTAGQISTIHDLDLSTWETWQSVCMRSGNQIGKDAFAIESKPYMYSIYPKGTFFVIDPNVKPIDGDMILIKIKENNTLTMRKIHIDPPEWYLYQLTSSCDPLKYSSKVHHIIGVVLLTIFYNHNN